MKKIKKFTLIRDVQVLTANEQKEIYGGETEQEGCAGKTYEKCSGPCVLDGYEGYCGWTYYNFNRCTCGIAIIGK